MGERVEFSTLGKGQYLVIFLLAVSLTTLVIVLSRSILKRKTINPSYYLNYIYLSRGLIYFSFLFIIEFLLLSDGFDMFSGTGSCKVLPYKSDCIDALNNTNSEKDCFSNMMHVQNCDDFSFTCKNLALSQCQQCSCSCKQFKHHSTICDMTRTNQFIGLVTMFIYNVLSVIYFYMVDNDVLQSKISETEKLGLARNFVRNEKERKMETEIVNSTTQLDEFGGREEEKEEEINIERIEENNPYLEGQVDKQFSAWSKSTFIFLYVTCCANIFFALAISTGFLHHPEACGGSLLFFDGYLIGLVGVIWLSFTWLAIIGFFLIHNLQNVDWQPEPGKDSFLLILTVLRRGVVVCAVLYWFVVWCDWVLTDADTPNC